MVRIEPKRTGPLSRFAGWYSRRRFGKEMDPVGVFAHHPRLMMGYSALERAFEKSGRVDKRIRMLAELKAATVTGCEWCIDFGSMLSRHEGVTEEQLRDLPRYQESDAFSDVEKLVLDYATAVTRTPVEVPDELFAELQKHFDEPQIVELTTGIALENFRARFNWAVGLQSQGFSEGAFCAIPERPATDQAALSS